MSSWDLCKVGKYLTHTKQYTQCKQYGYMLSMLLQVTELSVDGQGLKGRLQWREWALDGDRGEVSGRRERGVTGEEGR